MFMRLAVFCLMTVLAFGAKAESWTAFETAGTWSRPGGELSVRQGGGVYEVRFRGQRDWSLNPYPTIEVRPGDVFEFTCESEPLPGESADGFFDLGATTRDAAGDVCDWAFALARVAPGSKGVCRFMVPPGVAKLTPRITGAKSVAARISALTLVRTGNRFEGRPALPESMTLKGGDLEIEVSTADAGFAVTDSRTGRRWRTAASCPSSGALVTAAKETSDAVELTIVDPQSLMECSVRFALVPERNEFTVTVAGEGALTRPLDYPAPLVTQKGDRLIVPMNEGMGYPVEEEHIGLWREIAYGGHGLCMAFFGVDEDATGAGWMCVFETPDDAAMQTRRTDGMLTAGPSWDAQLGKFGYPRRVRYCFRAAGGHVAMAKRYRAYAKSKGLFKTLAEKAEARPAIDKLVGAANIWCWWGDESANLRIVGDMVASGMDHLLWSSDSTPAFLDAMRTNANVIAGRYDIYQDIMDPKHRDELPHWHGGWVTEAFPHDINWAGPSPEQWRHGWPVDAKSGPRIDCAVLCDRQALPYAHKRISEELATKRYQARFIDTTTASPWRECWNPAHPMTRTDSRVWKMKLLALVSDGFGLVCGCETGHDASVPFCDYFEGMLSLGPYRVDEAGRGMWKIVDDPPERVWKYQLGERYRLPLWELVYHECTIAQWYWGDYNNKIPAAWAKRDLFNALYGTPPMYMFKAHEWGKWKDRVVASYKVAEPVSRMTGYSEMTDHRFLTADRSVQRTRFANGVTVTVNFGAKPFALPEGGELAPGKSLVTRPENLRLPLGESRGV